MIITLVRADFSKANIGTLDSFAVLTNLGPGFSYDGPAFAPKNASFSASITLNSNCTLKSFDVTMGGTSLPDSYVIDGNTISINISAVTGLIIITGVAEGDVSIPDVWYITSLNDLAAAGVNLTSGTKLSGSDKYTPWAYDENFNSKLVGKTINAMEIVPSASGTFTIGKVNTSTSPFVYTRMATFTIDSADINTRKIYTFEPYTINEGEYFTFNEGGDSGLGYYFFTKDANGVEGVTKLNANGDAGSFTDFNYQIIPVFNIGHKTNVVDDTPEEIPPEVEPEEPEIPDTPVVDGNTTWYVSSLKQLQDSGNNLSGKVKLNGGGSAYSWAFQDSMNNKLVGKTINTIEMIAETAGPFYIGTYNPDTKTVSNQRVITISETGVTPIKYTFDEFTIPEGEYFTWNCSGKGSEAAGYYILKAKVDPLVVETSGWYQCKPTGLEKFAAHELAYIANIGYTAE